MSVSFTKLKKKQKQIEKHSSHIYIRSFEDESWKMQKTVRKKKKSSSIESDLKFQSLVLGRYLIWGYDTHGVFRKVSEVFLEKKNFGRSAEISASRDPPILVIFFEIWGKITKMVIFEKWSCPTSKKLFFLKGLLGY